MYIITLATSTVLMPIRAAGLLYVHAGDPAVFVLMFFRVSRKVSLVTEVIVTLIVYHP